MSTTVNMHEAKTHLSNLVERALKGEDIILARAGKPTVRLVPVGAASGKRPWGMDKGRIFIHDDWDDPIPELEEMT